MTSKETRHINTRPLTEAPFVTILLRDVSPITLFLDPVARRYGEGDGSGKLLGFYSGDPNDSSCRCRALLEPSRLINGPIPRLPL
jgi:hypothetical protein